VQDGRFPVPGLCTADGSPAYAFSSHNPATVDRHFRWMAEYGIDGVVLQHFAVDLPEGPLTRRFESRRRVLNCVRDAARRHGRAWDWCRDATPEWIGLLRRFDACMPWNVGNLVRDEGGERLASTGFREEDKAAVEHELGVLPVPVAYPGFTWDNVRRLPPGSSLVPRRGGHFLWNQFYRTREVGAECGFVAMFDEVDEATAVFKVADPPPLGAHPLGLEGRASDWYLRLVGPGTRMARREAPIRAEMPCSESAP
jgi:hypothetical protein